MIEINREVCDDCGACVSVCPENASVILDFLEIDTGICTCCRRCIKVCPFGALTLDKTEKNNGSN